MLDGVNLFLFRTINYSLRVVVIYYFVSRKKGSTGRLHATRLRQEFTNFVNFLEGSLDI